MMISNLTEGELEVLKELKQVGLVFGQTTKIARRLKKNRSGVSFNLKRLCESGHVIKVNRGEYIIAEGVNL